MEISLSIIPHKLTWVSCKYPPIGRVINSDLVKFTQDYPYTPLYSEIGPLDLGTTIHFCKRLESMLKNGPVTHYCSIKPIEKSNGAYLMGAFLILVMKKTPTKAWEIFQNLPLLFLHYREVTPGVNSHKCSILHCLQVLSKAVKFGWIKYNEFDVEDYRSIYSIEKGDITWLIPNKIVIFSTPCADPWDFKGFKNYTPEECATIFAKIT